jgi:hypothetical protein
MFPRFPRRAGTPAQRVDHAHGEIFDVDWWRAVQRRDHAWRQHRIFRRIPHRPRNANSQ